MRNNSFTKIYLGFLLWLISFTIHGQRFISGRITGAENDEPIVGASVFIATTTVGTSTDYNGNYRIVIPGEGSYRLVISHVGYQSVFKDIEHGNVSVVFDVVLNTNQIEEVTVAAKVRFRSKDINLFWKTILGKSPSKRTIYPTNPEDVWYYYNSETRILKVTCRTPIHIINNETGYHVQLMLDHFKHDYNTNYSTWNYECRFSDLEPVNNRQKTNWETKRLKIYRVSLTNFIKSLYHNRLLENGFLLAHSKKELGTELSVDGNLHKPYENPKTFLSIDSVDGTKTLHIPSDFEDLMLVCFGKPIDLSIEQMQKKEFTWSLDGLFPHYIKTPNGQVQIFPDGTYNNYLELSPLNSSSSLTGFDYILPLNYVPGIDPVEMSLFNETEVAIETLLAARFNQQLKLFPQEKIYLHTDKPFYFSGERIWFRAHLANAATHVPEPVSRYVYVELINPLDSIVTRVKIRQEEGAYHGYLLIPDDVPEGDYTMRAYTTFMQSQDENYFCTKTIHIVDPQAHTIHTETNFTFESSRRINVQLRFSNIITSEALVPKSVKVSVNGGKMMNLKMDSDGTTGFNFNLPANSRKRNILLELTVFNHPYRQYLQIPMPDDDFDVTFYPEGGSIMQGVPCKIAFKAMKTNGQAINISGKVNDQTGSKIIEFTSEHLGMGSFPFLAEKEKTYYATCENDKGQSKRFELPGVQNHGYALAISQLMDRINIRVLKPAEVTQNNELYLLAHTRGLIHFVSLWNHEKDLVLRRELFPSGVLHLVLFDVDRNPVSERLVFINNQDQAQVTYQSDKENFDRRSLVNNRVTITDSDGEPLVGNFSVSVTSDREVTLDSTSNILTQLLLSSDLRGNIENPAYYFQNNYTTSSAMDLLMCTQGWRRYNIAEIAQGRFSRPTFPIETGAEISGTVKSVLLDKPAKNIKVNITSLKNNYIEDTKTDKDGRFYFYDEFPDSTLFIVGTVQKSDRKRMEMILDKQTFPERTLFAVPYTEMDRMQFAKYADKDEMQYINEGVIRVYKLEEVTITAQRKPPRESAFYSEPNNSITEEEIEQYVGTSISSLLLRIPGVNVLNGKIEIRGSTSFNDIDPLLVVDDVPVKNIQEIVDIEDFVNLRDIAQIDVLKGPSTTVFGLRGAAGVIIIFTKKGENAKEYPPFNVRAFSPLGYQQPIEFYAPKYDTSEKQNVTAPDLRKTIHWQPVVQTGSDGIASFDFYTADKATTYTVVIEGLTNDGSIIRKEERLWRKGN